MATKPQLSVIIASYNSSKTVEECLESLNNQKTDKTFEIIVVDSSTDSTAILVEKSFPSVRLHKFPERKFCGDARNRGVSVAAGDIIAFIDADCVASSDWIGIDEETYKTYRKHGDFEKALRGLQLLVRRKNERGVSLPLINLRMLVTRHNERQVIPMRELAEEVGVDMLTLKTLCSFDNKTEGETLVPCNREYRRFEYDDKGKPIRKKNRCKKMWNHPTVYLDGTVVPCDYYTGHGFSPFRFTT